MTKNTADQIISPTIIAPTVETILAETANASAPMVQRLATARDKIDLAVKELESERFELISRRDLLRRQVEAVEAGLAMHIADVEATIALYEGGINALPADGSKGAQS